MTPSETRQADPSRLMSLAASLVDAGRFGDARRVGRELAARDYDRSDDASDVGVVLARMGMCEEAERQFEAALRMKPGEAANHFNLATVLRFRGDIPRAEECLDRAIELDPDDTDAWLLRSGLRKQAPGDNHIDALQAALRRVDRHPRKKVAICYALAKEFEDLERDDECFAALQEGGSTRRSHIDYDPDGDLSTIDRIRQVFDDSFFRDAGGGFADAGPIFVIGMPRTGTTLVEQILGQHSVVQAAGELSNFSMQLGQLTRAAYECGAVSGQDFVELTAGIDFERLGQAYIDSTRPLRAGRAHFVDKLPFNFLYAGLIHRALPKAKIIHVQRDPMDTCFAVYKTLFDAAYPYSYDLGELARYFVAYRRLMEHWYRVLPGVLHTVRYEALVTRTEAVVRDMLSYCDLSWETPCLEPSSGAFSATASAVQVRQGIYTGSIGRWRRFESHLRPVADILESAGIETSRDLS